MKSTIHSFVKKQNLILIIFLIAVMLRFFYILLFPQAPVNKSDAVRYINCAENILNGNGFVANKRYFHIAPSFPILMSSIFFFFGKNYQIIRLFQAVLSSLIAFFIYKIGDRIYNKKTGLIAASIVAVYPYFIYYSGLILTETLAILFLTISIYLLFDLLHGVNSSLKYLIAGIIFGITSLTKSTLFYLLVLLILFLIFIKININKQSIRKLILLVVGFLSILLPWMVRNYRLSNCVIPVTKDAGLMWYSNTGRLLDPDYKDYKGFLSYESSFYRKALQDSSGDLSNIQIELMVDDYYSKKTLRLIRKYPLRFFKGCLYRIKRFWAIYPMQYAKNEFRLDYFLFGIFSFGLIFPLFFCGIFLGYKENKRDTLLLLFVIVFFTLLYSMILGMIRYRLPIEPIIILFASVTINKFLNIKRVKNQNW